MTTEGARYYVGRWGRSWAVFDEAEVRGEPLRIFESEVEAQRYCDRRNEPRGKGRRE